MKNKLYILVAIIALLPFVSIAQTTPLWEIKINAGLSIGGTSPLPLPVEVRKIEKFTPMGFAPRVAAEAIYWMDEKWGVAAQLSLDYKGFSVDNRVKNLRTEIDMGDEKYVGNFTGKNTTTIRNSYITLPVLLTCKLSDRWLMQFGPYFAYLNHPDFKGSASDGYIREGSPIGQKTTVEQASFDFSEHQSRFDVGAIIAGEWKFYHELALRGQIAWGLKPIFPSDFTGMSFKMYNIYGTLGISYRLKTF
ncbi:PorT family protein [Bacteroidales bacterium OttesenSCG-928-I14]|nr:PorT family protein [Bacteroidales bacterium OttesenSCG-928-I14]